MTSPEISIIMPVYNGGKYLNEAIDSILQQTFTDFEFIIINDGSTDNSLKIIKSYNDERILLIIQKNQGVAKSLNNGIKIAKGKYIARMDADDISYKNRLEIQYNFLENNQNVVAVGGNAYVIDQIGTYVYTTDYPLINKDIKSALSFKSPFIHSSVVLRKNTVERAGLYPKIPIAQDIFLFNKMSGYGDFANIPQPLIKYRLTPTASTMRTKLTLKILKDAIEYYATHNKFSDDHFDKINASVVITSSNQKHYQYHLLLSKKYLWDNYQPTLSRKNISMALKYKKTSAILYFLYILSYLPQNIVRAIYQGFKRV